MKNSCICPVCRFCYLYYHGENKKSVYCENVGVLGLDNKKGIGFIGYEKNGVFPVKRTPRWCPENYWNLTTGEYNIGGVTNKGTIRKSR